MTVSQATAKEASAWFNQPRFRPAYGGAGRIALPDEGLYLWDSRGMAALLPVGGRMWDIHVAADADGIGLGRASVRWFRENVDGVLCARIPDWNLKARRAAIAAGGRFVGEIQNAVVYDGHPYALRYYAWDS